MDNIFQVNFKFCYSKRLTLRATVQQRYMRPFGPTA